MKILVIRFRQIGDAILSSVICKSLKKSFPEAEIDYVLYDGIAQLFEGQPYITNVINFSKSERENPIKYLKKVREITKKKYDIIIDIMSTPKSELISLFSLNSKIRIGRDKKMRGICYTDTILEPDSKYDKPEKFLKMLEPLEKKGYKIVYDKNYEIYISDEERENIREKMQTEGIDFRKILIPLAVTSRRVEKKYPKDLMKKVAEMILKRYNAQLILYYSPEEEKEIKEFHESLNWDKRVISSIKTRSIKELAAMFKECDIFIGNEGGPRHLAQAVGIPSISIFNPGTSKKCWLTNGRDDHLAIDINDFNIDKIENKTHEEKYRLMTPEMIMELVDKGMKFVRINDKIEK